MDTRRPHEIVRLMQQRLDIAKCLAKEVAFINDDACLYGETPAQRWDRVRSWVSENIKAEGGAS